jgi:tetratricopeptide (TPR) repeat protein
MMRVLFLFIQLLLLLAVPAASASTDLSKLIQEGDLHWSENRLVEAESAFRKAIEKDPDSSLGYSRLGALLVMQNRAGEAVTAYQEAIIREPDNARYFAALSIAYLHTGYHEMARTMAQRAAELDPGMKQAEDISKYIDAKLERMSALAAQKAHSSLEPEAIHNNEEGKLQSYP